jgi:TAT (twin-arginine translocation) pathway signal sequence
MEEYLGQKSGGLHCLPKRDGVPLTFVHQCGEARWSERKDRENMQRRDFFKGMAATAGMGALAESTLSPVQGQVRGTVKVGGIYQLQAAFHRAKTTQDIDLMMALWDVDGVLNNQGDPNSPYVGFDKLKAFWLNSGSFKNRRFSLVPSFKIAIDVHGELAWLYFECHDVGDFDLDTRSIATDTFLAGMIRKVNGDWVFSNMTAGKASPLSVTQYYFPI